VYGETKEDDERAEGGRVLSHTSFELGPKSSARPSFIKAQTLRRADKPAVVLEEAEPVPCVGALPPLAAGGLEHGGPDLGHVLRCSCEK
jgi:hypothetical protein